MEMKVGVPVKPALASPSKGLENLVKRTGLAKTGRVAVESKIDGFRCQAHVNGGVGIYTRSLNELNIEAYPEIQEGLESLGVENAILDGELIEYNSDTGKHVSFQETMRRKRKTKQEDLFPLKYVLFDVLMLEDQSLVDRPYTERRRFLEDLNLNETITLVEMDIAETVEDIRVLYGKALDADFEGIMVKKLDSLYPIGKRNNSWVKYKPEVTVDGVILGWYHGNGVRETWGNQEGGIGALLFGAYDPVEKNFKTFVKCGTGLSKDWSIEILDKLKSIEMQEPLAYVNIPKSKRPDHWVEPTYVMELRGQEIT